MTTRLKCSQKENKRQKNQVAGIDQLTRQVWPQYSIAVDQSSRPHGNGHRGSPGMKAMLKKASWETIDHRATQEMKFSMQNFPHVNPCRRIKKNNV